MITNLFIEHINIYNSLIYITTYSNSNRYFQTANCRVIRCACVFYMTGHMVNGQHVILQCCRITRHTVKVNFYTVNMWSTWLVNKITVFLLMHKKTFHRAHLHVRTFERLLN